MGDPLMTLLARWEEERKAFARSGSAGLIELSETHSRELMEALALIGSAKVPYECAQALTGYSLGSLKNTVPNAGSRSEPAFRLSDLPFKAGYASPSKLIMAALMCVKP